MDTYASLLPASVGIRLISESRRPWRTERGSGCCRDEGVGSPWSEVVRLCHSSSLMRYLYKTNVILQMLTTLLGIITVYGISVWKAASYIIFFCCKVLLKRIFLLTLNEHGELSLLLLTKPVSIDVVTAVQCWVRCFAHSACSVRPITLRCGGFICILNGQP